MLEGVEIERLLAMTNREKRWLDNIKKAFYDSDIAFKSGRPEDHCLAELFKAIDTAKTLRRSLRGEPVTRTSNRDLFIEFLGLEIPMARPGESEWSFQLKDGTTKKCHFGEIVYDIRCMIHENENLNAAEDVDYHILLDWSRPHSLVFAHEIDGKSVFNGRLLCSRLRQVLAKFITVIDGLISFAANQSFEVSCEPSPGAIVPERKPRPNPIPIDMPRF